MASGLEDMGKESASTAGRKETASEKEDDLHGKVVLVEGENAVSQFGNCGLISVLFEMPSGFAIFGYDAVKLTQPDASKHIWADFVGVLKAFVWLKDSLSFEDKGTAISDTTVSRDLRTMIEKNVANGEILAVGNVDYGYAIWKSLRIRWVCNDAVNELMWGLNIQMPHLLPIQYSELTNKDSFPMSNGMVCFLKSHSIVVDPAIMVPISIIQTAANMYECDRYVNKYDTSLRLAAEYLKKISLIDTAGWDLLKVATAFKIICCPEEKNPLARKLFPEKQLRRLMTDAPRYQDKIMKNTCLKVYAAIYSAREARYNMAVKLVHFFSALEEAYEHKQAGKGASYHETSPDTKKIRRGFAPVQSPNSFMDVKCQGCSNITTVFSHSQTVVVCSACQTVLCQPTGGKARLTEGCSFCRKAD